MKLGSWVMAVLLAVLAASVSTSAQAMSETSLDVSHDGGASALLAAVIWFALLLAIPVWACGLTYGIIGINVGRQWPDPSCCCYRAHKSGGDRGSSYGCAPLLRSCVVLLVLQAVYVVLHVALMIVDGGMWVLSFVGLIFDAGSLSVLIAAVALLRKGYHLHGGPSPPGSTERPPLTAHVLQMVPVHHPGAHVPTQVGVATVAYGTPAHYSYPPAMQTATVTMNHC
mmetsp:Transcript_33168/g.86024  ORF Transcript_33168/g.86024 Transcript_33168/m.86024 type:complete len:226 (+) Transcript_33168:179-856(+)